MSDPGKADIEHQRLVVRFWPKADLDQKRRSNTDFFSPVIRGGLAIGKRRFWSCPKELRPQTGELSSASGMRTRLNEAGT